MMKIVCLAVVGKANNPLYIKTFDPNVEGLKFHYIVHTALDIVEERVVQTSGGAKKSADLYLGMLCPSEDYKIYGYITTTKNKLIVIIEDYDVKEHEIKLFFKNFHSLFSDAICNPFYTAEEAITSKQFDDSIVLLVKSKSPESQITFGGNRSKLLNLEKIPAAPQKTNLTESSTEKNDPS